MKLNSEGKTVIGVSSALTGLAAISIAVRLFARWKLRFKLQLNDYLAIAAFVFIVGLLVEHVLWVELGGVGQHFYNLTSYQQEEFFKISLAGQFTYWVTTSSVKLSILAFLWTTFPIKWFRMIIYILTGLCIGWAISAIIVSAVQCNPLSKFWDYEVPGTCINTMAFMDGVLAINIFLDASIFSLPWPMVWKLQRPWRAKLAMSVVFLLGAFAVAASCVRMWTWTMVFTNDPTYDSVEDSIWTVVEPCIGLICASLPMIWGLCPSVMGRASRKGKTESTKAERRGPSLNHFNRAIYGSRRYQARAEWTGRTPHVRPTRTND